MSLRHWCELGVEAPLVIQLLAGGLQGGLELTCTEVLPPLELDIDHLPDQAFDEEEIWTERFAQVREERGRANR